MVGYKSPSMVYLTVDDPCLGGQHVLDEVTLPLMSHAVTTESVTWASKLLASLLSWAQLLQSSPAHLKLKNVLASAT